MQQDKISKDILVKYNEKEWEVHQALSGDNEYSIKLIKKKRICKMCNKEMNWKCFYRFTIPRHVLKKEVREMAVGGLKEECCKDCFEFMKMVIDEPIRTITMLNGMVVKTEEH
jgi:hypothetical protein